MKSQKPAVLAWSARIGVAALVAGSLAALAQQPASAAVIATISPNTGPAGGTISINAPANTFTTSSGQLKLANTGGVVNANAIQFTTATCPTVAGPIPSSPRTVTDAVTTIGTGLTSATAAFTATDVGRVISGPGIAPGVTIATVTNATTLVLSAASTAAATVTASIGVRKVTDLVTTNASTTVTSATAAFTSADIGKPIVSANLTPATAVNFITAVNSPTSVVVTTAATASGAAGVATIGTLSPLPYLTTPSTDVTVVSGAKLIVTTPSTMASSAAGLTYNVCTYDTGGTLATVLTTGSYKVYAAPTITDVSSTSGSAQGGSTITVTGTNITTLSKVTIGGTALVNPVVSTVAGTIVGTVPAHEAGAVPLILTNEGGPVTYGTNYTYYDGLNVSPQQISTTGSTVLDIYGVGFKDPMVNFVSYANPTTLGTVTAVDPVADTLTTSAGFALAANARVKLGVVGPAITGGLVTGGTYWVKSDVTTVLTLSSTPGGPAVDITGLTDVVSAVYDVTNQAVATYGATTFTAVGSLVGVTSTTGLALDDVVRFTGVATTANITSGAPYFVVGTLTSTTFQIAATKGGSPIAPSVNGTASNTWRGADANTHVVLALGTYNPTSAPGTVGAPVAECGSVRVVDDSEIICTLVNPSLQEGNYQVLLLDNVRQGTDRSTIVTSTSAFTSGPY
jgi:hypothetical protein